MMFSFIKLLWGHIKGALCSFGDEIQTQNLNIYNIIELIMQQLKYLSFP